jgi:hypothetical protein
MLSHRYDEANGARDRLLAMLDSACAIMPARAARKETGVEQLSSNGTIDALALPVPAEAARCEGLQLPEIAEPVSNETAGIRTPAQTSPTR